MKEQQQKSDRERKQMILDHDNILREQKELKLLNQQLQAQVFTLQNKSMRAEGDAENGVSPDLCVLEELIQKRIVEGQTSLALGSDYSPPRLPAFQGHLRA